MDIQHIQLTPKIKALGAEESRTLRFIGSTETPDRAEDIVSVAGWEVKNYLKNPIVLWAHRNDIPPIAKAKSVYIDERAKALVFDIDFPKVEDISDPANPSEHALFVDTIYRMCKAGLLNAVSVGFRGIEVNPREDQNGPMYMRGSKFKRQELLELSVVPVPANPDALVTARGIPGMNVKGLELVEKSFAKEEDMDIKELTEKNAQLEAKIAELETKGNRRLSKASMARVAACQDHMAKAMDELKALVSDGVLVDDDDTSGGVEKPRKDAEVPEKKAIDLSASVDEMNEYLRSIANTSKE